MKFFVCVVNTFTSRQPQKYDFVNRICWIRRSVTEGGLILCLHGYHQNKDIFRQKTGSFRKPLKKYADFEFLDAPHLLKESLSQDDSLDPAYLQKISGDISEDGRGWWLKHVPESDGLQASLEHFKTYLNDNGPFDGVMGFSQGAAFLALACILLEEEFLSKSLKFVILVSGFKSLIPAHGIYYETSDKVRIPSLHVIGETDEIISSDRSRQLVEVFGKAEVVTHPGGHYVPASREIRDVYVPFIVKFCDK